MEPFSSNFVAHLYNRNVHMHSMALSLKGRTTAEFYYSPIGENSLQRVFSVCKTFTGIAIGLLADEGKIALDEPICKYFQKYVSNDTHHWLCETTIEDMLMMRSCHVNSTYNKFDLRSDWVGSFFQTEPTKEPGTSFDYDTSASHVLCALVEDLTGMKLLDYIRSRIPELGISDEAYTLIDGQGYSQGGTGLMCKTSDMLKLGNMLLYCNIEGKEPAYLSPFMISYIKKATSKLTDTSCFGKSPFEKQGYGYLIWRAQHNGILVYGMGGQFIMIHPDKELVFVCTCDNIGYSSKNQLIFDLFYEDIYEKLPQNWDFLEETRDLSVRIQHLEMLHLSSDIKSPYDLCKKWRILDDVSIFTGVTYDIGDHDHRKLILHSEHVTHELVFGLNKNVSGILSGYNIPYVGSGAFVDESTLIIHLELLGECLGSVDFTLSFNEDCCRLESVKHEETLLDEFNFVCDLVQ